MLIDKLLCRFTSGPDALFHFVSGDESAPLSQVIVFNYNLRELIIRRATFQKERLFEFL